MALIRLIVVEIRKLELDTTIIIIIVRKLDTTQHHQQQQQQQILRSGAPWIKIDEGDPVEWKIVIFLPLREAAPR